MTGQLLVQVMGGRLLAQVTIESVYILNNFDTKHRTENVKHENTNV